MIRYDFVEQGPNDDADMVEHDCGDYVLYQDAADHLFDISKELSRLIGRLEDLHYNLVEPTS